MDLIALIRNYLVGAAMVSIADAVNTGRMTAYEELEDKIGAYMWSAILDKRVCPICKELDGKYFSPKDPLLDMIKPPIHSGCRCILVAVLQEELDVQPVPITRLTHSDVRRWTRNKWWLA